MCRAKIKSKEANGIVLDGRTEKSKFGMKMAIIQCYEDIAAFYGCILLPKLIKGAVDLGYYANGKLDETKNMQLLKRTLVIQNESMSVGREGAHNSLIEQRWGSNVFDVRKNLHKYLIKAVNAGAPFSDPFWNLIRRSALQAFDHLRHGFVCFALCVKKNWIEKRMCCAYVDCE